MSAAAKATDFEKALAKDLYVVEMGCQFCEEKPTTENLLIVHTLWKHPIEWAQYVRQLENTCKFVPIVLFLNRYLEFYLKTNLFIMKIHANFALG